MNTLTIEMCVNALNWAAMSRKSIFQVELSVGVAVYLMEGDANKAAKQDLTAVYASAGYDCLVYGDGDYKTVNRRVNATAELFHKLGVKMLRKWTKGNSDEKILDAIVDGLRDYELYNVMDVYRFCRPTAAVPKTKASPQVAVTPAPDLLGGPTPAQVNANSGLASVVGMFKRAAEQVAKGAKHLETQHLAVAVPNDTPRDELIELAMWLLAMADEMKKEELVTAP